MFLPGRAAALRRVGRWQDGVDGDTVRRPYGTWKPKWFRRCCNLPVGNVGATRWVARRCAARWAAASPYVGPSWHDAAAGDAPRRRYLPPRTAAPVVPTL